MNKCQFTVLGSMGLCAMQLSVYAQSVQSPNIIFILTDDQRWDAMGIAGNEFICTPEMDRLAREGVYYRNAFATTPISAASRASILTGMYERTHGYTFQTGNLKDCYINISYPVELRKAGYYTGYFGKLGVELPNAESMFDQAEIFDRKDNYPDYRGYYYKEIDGDTLHLTEYTAYKALEFIASVPSDRPFCLSLGFSAPHAHDPAPEQYFWTEKSDTLYQDQVMPDPVLKEEKYFLQLPEEVRSGFNRVRWHWRYDTPAKYQHSVKGYYRMISDVDYEIGRIRSALEKKGIADNTVIIFMGDNGYYMGERQLAGKWLMHENSLRVPLIVYDPRIRGGKVVDAPVLNIDIPSTLMDLAGAPAPKEWQGSTLCSYYDKKHKRPNRHSILFEHLWKIKEIPSSEAIRTSRYKYIRYRLIEAPEELYDLKRDPLETKNLAMDPAYADILSEMRRECNAKIAYYQSLKLK